MQLQVEFFTVWLQPQLQKLVSIIVAIYTQTIIVVAGKKYDKILFLSTLWIMIILLVNYVFSKPSEN